MPGVQFIKYTALRDLGSGKTRVIFEQLPWQPVEGPGVDYRSVADIVDYCTMDQAKSALQRIIAELESAGIRVSPQRGGRDYWLECAFGGNPVTYLQPRRKYFNCQTTDDPNDDYSWKIHRVDSYEQWVRECRDSILALTKAPDVQTE